MSPGRKFNEWEQKGAPLRLELGPKDLDEGVVVVANRLSGDKERIPLGDAVTHLQASLDAFHTDLLARASTFREDHSFVVDDYENV